MFFLFLFPCWLECFFFFFLILFASAQPVRQKAQSITLLWWRSVLNFLVDRTEVGLHRVVLGESSRNDCHADFSLKLLINARSENSSGSQHIIIDTPLICVKNCVGVTSLLHPRNSSTLKMMLMSKKIERMTN